MLNVIWLGMVVLAVVFGFINGKIDAVVAAVTDSAKLGFELGLGLTGIMIFWLGIMAVAEGAGLTALLAKGLKPILARLFPDVPPDHPALGSIVMNVSANMLGLGNAATPFGLKAMKELQTLNPTPTVASDAMCTFLAINTASIQIIPATAIAFLAANHCSNPSVIIISSLFASSMALMVAIITVKRLARFPMFKLQKAESL